MSSKLKKTGKTSGKEKKQEMPLSKLLMIIGGICLAAVLFVVVCFALFMGKKTSSVTEQAGVTEEAAEWTQESAQGPKVEIKVKDYGTIQVQLDENAAPITVENFVNLVKDNFYDGLTFHRIISGFMIQGGDPEGNGTGGSENKIKGEFSSNGVNNPIKHDRGVISMARSNDKDSASSQFFIMHQNSPHLDGEYAAFGFVTSGMEVVDKICEETKVEDNNGTVKAENQPVIESIRIIE